MTESASASLQILEARSAPTVANPYARRIEILRALEFKATTERTTTGKLSAVTVEKKAENRG